MTDGDNLKLLEIKKMVIGTLVAVMESGVRSNPNCNRYLTLGVKSCPLTTTVPRTSNMLGKEVLFLQEID
jgi:hypothetical protein